MSRKPFKVQASSSRVGFGSAAQTFGSSSSPLSYLAEQPNLSLLADPGVVVSFKNLTKKDSTTRTKALEEIQAWLTANPEPEEAFLDAWQKVFPRLSIDNARRARQLSLSIHGQLAKATGKRIVPYLPKTIGAWLAGQFDADKGVARAAQDALSQVFPTPEKRSGVKKTFQSAILEFCRNSILDETPQTLSDERVTTADDADAKYGRVIAGAVSTITNLLSTLSKADVEKCYSQYEQILEAQVLWAFIASKEPQVRRAIFTLLNVCLQEFSGLIEANLPVIGKQIFSKSSARHQGGSSLAFSESMLVLTKTFPDVWTSVSKSTPLELLQNVVKHGSHGGQPQFWANLSRIIASLPRDKLPDTPEQAKSSLNAIESGLTRKDEPRLNLEAGWKCYFSALEIFTSRLSSVESLSVHRDVLEPMLEHYLDAFADHTERPVGTGSLPASVIANAFVSSYAWSVAEDTWPEFARRFEGHIKVSAPEQSKEFVASQNAVASQAQKWFSLEKLLLRASPTKSFISVSDAATESIIQTSVDSLGARNGKPFGAAAVIEAAVVSNTPRLSESGSLRTLLDDFLVSTLPNLSISPSSPRLFRTLYSLQALSNFDKAWDLTLNFLLDLPDGPEKEQSLESFLNPRELPSDFDRPLKNERLQSSILLYSNDLLDNGVSQQLIRCLGPGSNVMGPDAADQLLSKITEQLSKRSQTRESLLSLQQITRNNKHYLRSFLESDKGSALLQAVLLVLESSDDDDARLASELNQELDSLTGNDQTGRSLQSSALEIIRRGLYEASPSSLSVDTLLDLAVKYVGSSEQDVNDRVAEVMPNINQWQELLSLLLDIKPSPSIAFTNPLGGAVYLLHPNADSQPSKVSQSLSTDLETFTPPLRIALYVVQIFQKYPSFQLPDENLSAICRLLHLTSQVVNDELSIAGSTGAWNDHHTSIDDLMQDLVTNSLHIITSLPLKVTKMLGDELWKSAVGDKASAFASARAFASLYASISEDKSYKSIHNEDVDTQLRLLRKSTEPFQTPAFIAAFPTHLETSSYLTRFCNELVSDLTASSLDSNRSLVLRQIAHLNVMLRDQEHLVDAIAKQRLVFFVKHIVGWLSSDSETDLALGLALRSEILRALEMVLPTVHDVYDEFWEAVLHSVVESFNRTDLVVPLLHSSLKVVQLLRALLRDEETNDDLRDAWSAMAPDLAQGMIAALQRCGSLSDRQNQPLRITNELLARQVKAMPSERLGNASNLFSLIQVESPAIQQTAFDILHKQIPKAQEEVSLNAALDKTTAKLPEELLSLIIDAPGAEILDEADFESSMPSPLRGYLSSWLLVFDHFRNASDKVKTDYAANLKEGDYLEHLLSFIFTFLGHAKGKPLDVSKFSVSTFSFDIEESPIKEVQWLLTYLYYLSLKRLPSLTKSWWLDCKSRQLHVNVETWTEKYISPYIISDTLAVVDEWNETQDSTSDEALVVKTNTRTHEITASKEIDEQQLSIVIHLPPNFPLSQAIVEGRNRVAVDEKKWNSWLLNCRGVIQFSNNSITDGLVAFRRNVVGALKGHTECAICYSLVSADKQLPSKKCATCKNAFHGSCLYRWFKSSNSSSCPLCRNPFNYS